MKRILGKLLADKAGQVPMELPMPLLRLHGSFAFAGGWNPLVEAVTAGPAGLAAFYRAFQPASVAEFYFLERKGGVGAALPPWALPWLGWAAHRPPSAEGGLDPASHGVSYYGPCSAEKIAFEHDRLARLRGSIEAEGYRPDRFGHVEGFLMLRGAEARFFVRGGKHRAAVMAALGHATLPVIFKPGWPSVVNRDDADRWPLVAEGRMDAGLARAVFDRYFDTDGSQQAQALGLV